LSTQYVCDETKVTLISYSSSFSAASSSFPTFFSASAIAAASAWTAAANFALNSSFSS